MYARKNQDRDLEQRISDIADALIQHEQDERRSLEQLTRAVDANTAAIETLIKETKDIVRIYAEFRFAANAAKKTQRFVWWFAKWGVILSGFSAIGMWVKKALGE